MARNGVLGTIFSRTQDTVEDNMHLFVNLLIFKVSWLIVIWSAANAMPLSGLLAVSLAVLIHLITCRSPANEVLLLLAIGFVGFLWETLLLTLGLVEYSSGMFHSQLAPYWMVALWILFATTLNVSFARLQNNLALAAAFGAVAGPVSFFAGSRIGAVTIVSESFGFAILSLGWALFLPLVLWIAKFCNETEFDYSSDQALAKLTIDEIR